MLNNVRARLKDHPDVIIRKKEGAPWDKVKSDHPNEKYTSEYAVQLLIENAEKHDDMVSYSMLIHKIYNPNMEVDIYNLERFNAKNVPDNPLQVWIRKKSAKQEALRHAGTCVLVVLVVVVVVLVVVVVVVVVCWFCWMT